MANRLDIFPEIFQRMVNGECINHWTCLSFASRVHVNDIRMFCEDLVGMCNNIGMVNYSLKKSVNLFL